MQTTTLGELRTSIAGRADLPVLSATTFITQAEMDRWINQSARRLMNMLIEAHGEGHFEKTQTITTTANQDYEEISGDADAPHGNDIYRVLYLRVTLDGTRIDMKRSNAEGVDLEDPSNNFAWTLAYPPRWHFREHMDQRFVWSRTPLDAHTVTIHLLRVSRLQLGACSAQRDVRCG